MTKSEYDFVKAEIERETTGVNIDLYLACRKLPPNYKQLKQEYIDNKGIFNKSSDNDNLLNFNLPPSYKNKGVIISDIKKLD